jgi:hypothetical protein
MKSSTALSSNNVEYVSYIDILMVLSFGAWERGRIIDELYLNLNIRHMEHALRVDFDTCQALTPAN